MMLLRVLWSALFSLWTKKTRSLLTMLGVTIGVAQIIALVGLGEGIRKDVGSEVEQLGTNVLLVLPGNLMTPNGGFNPTASVGASTLTEADVAELRSIPGIVGVTPLGLMAALPTAGERRAAGSIVLAAAPGLLDLMNMYHLTNGRFFSADDNDGLRKVVVLSTGAARALFPGITPKDVVGKTMNLGRYEFSVIGTVEMKQTNSMFSMAGRNFDQLVIVPFKTAKLCNPNVQIFRIGIKASTDADARAIKATIAERLKQLHGAEDITVFTQEDALKVLDNILSIITKATVALASISLFVGGIGIMNIMLVAVSERTKEIGVRKALGATRASILGQFLTEAITIGLIGGALGVGLVSVASSVVHQKVGITIVVGWRSVLIATIFSIGVGIIFGLLPAIRAARKDPIEALRYE